MEGDNGLEFVKGLLSALALLALFVGGALAYLVCR